MNKHVPQHREQFAQWLHEVAEMVRAGDSLEGFISYIQPTPADGPCDFMVHMRLRTGNRMGQGGMILVERMEPDLTSIESTTTDG